MISQLGVWIHNLDPFIFEIDGVGPRWYGLAYIVGLLAGWYIIRNWAKQDRIPLRPELVQDLIVYFGLGMIIGGRLGYCFFYDTDLLMPPWQILYVWNGGMASHGGIIGMFIGVILFCRKHKIPFLVIADVSAVVTPIGIFTGRIANFINGELWGRPTDVAWGMRFPSSLGQDFEYRLHQQLHAAGDPAVHSEAWMQIQNQVALHYQQAVSQIHAATPGSDAWKQAINEYVLIRHPSQLYAAALEGILVLVIGLLVHRCHRRPGLSLGVVLSVYAIVRYIDEFWRNPDAGYALFFGWMSKGQALSIPLLVVGLAFIAWAYRRGSKPDLYSLETLKSSVQ